MPSYINKEGVYELFRQQYQQGHLTAAQLAAVYAEDVIFRDPLHTLFGLPAVTAYFAALGQNLNTCRFEFIDEIVTPEAAHITWLMRFSHRSIAGGRELAVRGMTLVKIQGEHITYHEDSFDLGAMIYENLPLMGSMVKAVKRHASGGVA